MSKTPPVEDLLLVLSANDLRLSRKPDEAVLRLESMVNGSERFQTHVALLDAYADAGMTTKALEQAQWLTAHRGLAYIELGCGWSQQPLNVFDTTLAHLRAAELLVQLDRKAEVNPELAVFDRRWPTADLPDHLRVRRDALSVASK